MFSLLGLWLGCVGEPAPADLWVAEGAPSPPTFTLAGGPLVAGQTVSVTASGLPSGTTVHLAVSPTGLGAGPCPAPLRGSCIDIMPLITVIGSRSTGPAGSTTWTVPVPAALPTPFAAFQAVVLQPGPAMVSNTLPLWVHPSGSVLTPGTDADGDGWTLGDGDCWDAGAAVNPGATDAFGDHRDSDCDGVDGSDHDGDGVLAVGAGGLDCDDDDAGIRPGAIEVCDGVDQDCDGVVDDGLITDGAGCADAGPPAFPSTVGVLQVAVRTGTGTFNDSDDNQLEVCVNTTSCWPLSSPNYDDFELGAVDVFTIEGLSVPRSAIDRVEIRSLVGPDAWYLDCLQVMFDGEPVYCDEPDLYLGTDPGDVQVFSDLTLHLACGTCFAEKLTHGPIVGEVHPDAARLWVRTDATRRSELFVAEDAGHLYDAPVAVRYPAASSDFTQTVAVSGLEPDTTYHYAWSVDGGAPVESTFRTAPPDGPGTLKMAFGSCSRVNDQPIFAAIDAQNPDLFLFVGDNHYGNTNDVTDLRQFYRWAHSRDTRDDLMRHVPTLAVWDDHDFVGNDTLGSAPGKENALRVFKEYWANDDFGTTAVPGIFSTARWGDVELFLLDDRYWRGLDGTLLGADQTAWLEAELVASDAAFKLLVTGSQWTYEGSADSWASYAAALDDLLAFVRDERIGGVVVMSGDVHRAEFRTIPGAPGGYTVPELTSSPLANSNFGCTPSAGMTACEDTDDYFVQLDIDTTLPDPTLTATMRNVVGSVLHTWVIRASELQVPASPPPGARRSDFDGDGYDDLAIGVPGENGGAGGVTLVYGSTAGLDSYRSEIWTQDTAGVPGTEEAGDSFGAAVATGDFDGDGWADLAVGAPDEDIGSTSNSGFLEIFYGSPTGLGTAGSQEWYQGLSGLQDVAEVADRFGAALAVGDFDGDGFDDLAIGVPGEGGWGAVSVLYGSSSGLESTRDQLWDQSTTGAVSANEAGDAFGAALAAGDFDGDGWDDLAIGHPGEDIGAVADAGMLTVVHGGAAGLASTRDQEINQDSASVPGTAEAGDRFGEAMAAGDVNGDGRDDLLASAPDDEVGSAMGAGLVIGVYGGSGGLDVSSAVVWELTNPAFGTTPAAGDHLGADVAVGDVDGDGYAEVVLGAPGRAAASADGAGVVWVLPGSPSGAVVGSFYTLDQTDLDEVSAEVGDGFGGALSLGDHDGDGLPDLDVGVQAEDIGSVVDAGLVQWVPGGVGGLEPGRARRLYADLDLMAGDSEPGDRLGAALP